MLEDDREDPVGDRVVRRGAVSFEDEDADDDLEEDVPALELPGERAAPRPTLLPLLRGVREADGEFRRRQAVDDPEPAPLAPPCFFSRETIVVGLTNSGAGTPDSPSSFGTRIP